MQLRKYLSQQRILARKETEKLVSLGKIKINGIVIKDSIYAIDPQKDKIEIVGGAPEKTTIVFNKPRGISSSRNDPEDKNIFDLLPQFIHLNTIGRLDKESEGLILLSNDGVLTNVITGRDHLIEKEYIVDVREEVTQTKINALSQGMVLEDGLTLPAKARKISDHSFVIVLKEGRNHQIRRMANKIRLTVTQLKRTRIGTISLDNLPVGGFRYLDKNEIQKFKQIKGWGFVGFNTFLLSYFNIKLI